MVSLRLYYTGSDRGKQVSNAFRHTESARKTYIMIKSIFVIRFTVFAARAPVDKGNSTDRRRLPSHGRIPGVSTAFNPRAAQPHHAGQCFVSHYQPEQSQCQPTLPKSARHRFYRSPKISPPGHGAHCANAHPSGRLPVLLVCTFQGAAKGEVFPPFAVLPKKGLGEYPHAANFSKYFFMSRRIRSLRLITARWVTPIRRAYSLVERWS